MNIKAAILTELEHEITAIKTFDDRINLIATYAKKYTEAERCSIFVYKEETNQLQSIYSDGMPVLTINSNTGLVGYAFHKRETIAENNVASSRYFFKEFDKKSGYKTQYKLILICLQIPGVFHKDAQVTGSHVTYIE